MNLHYVSWPPDVHDGDVDSKPSVYSQEKCDEFVDWMVENGHFKERPTQPVTPDRLSVIINGRNGVVIGFRAVSDKLSGVTR